MGHTGRKASTVVGLLTSMGLAVPVAAMPACEANPVGTENPAPDVGSFDAPQDTHAVPDGPIGTENPAPDVGSIEEDAPTPEDDAATDDAGDDAE